MVQVSWLRWSDMSVLTVGGLVFSSDPRLLVTMTQLSPSTVSWKLYISRCVAWGDIKHISSYNFRVTYTDAGDYQCQLNTEPKQSLDFTLAVTGTWCFIVNSRFCTFFFFPRQHYEGGSPCRDRWWRNVQCFQCWQFWQQSETKTRQIIFSISQRNSV